MKKMKYAKIALAAVISAALLQGGTALAKKKGELSVYEWGPWAVMARPAAGPQFVAYTPKGNPDPYHPTPKPVPPTPPVEGQHVGWATYSLYSSKTVYVEGEDGKPVATQQIENKGSILADFVMSIQPADEQTPVQYRGNVLGFANIKASYTVYPPILAKLADYPKVASPEMPGLSPMNIVYDPDGTFTDIQGVLGTVPAAAKLKIIPFYAEKGIGSIGSVAPGTFSAVEGLVLKSEPWNLDMVVGGWGNEVRQANGDFESTDYGTFVYGTTTSLAAIDGLQAGNVTAHYTGTTMVNRTPVDITIDFGNGSWHGSWNGGADGDNVKVVKGSLNVWHATGNMGFNARGTLSGANLITKSISAGDGTVDLAKSVVENAVFGNKAQIVGGGYQITKTLTNRAYNNVDGYPVTTTATQADITIAVDKKLVDLHD